MIALITHSLAPINNPPLSPSSNCEIKIACVWVKPRTSVQISISYLQPLNQHVYNRFSNLSPLTLLHMIQIDFFYSLLSWKSISLSYLHTITTIHLIASIKYQFQIFNQLLKWQIGKFSLIVVVDVNRSFACCDVWFDITLT